MSVAALEHRFHQDRGPSPEVSPRKLTLQYLPPALFQCQNRSEWRNRPSSSPNSLAIVRRRYILKPYKVMSAGSSKMPLWGSNLPPDWVRWTQYNKPRFRFTELLTSRRCFFWQARVSLSEFSAARRVWMGRSFVIIPNPVGWIIPCHGGVLWNDSTHTLQEFSLHLQLGCHHSMWSSSGSSGALATPLFTTTVTQQRLTGTLDWIKSRAWNSQLEKVLGFKICDNLEYSPRAEPMIMDTFPAEDHGTQWPLREMLHIQNVATY